MSNEPDLCIRQMYRTFMLQDMKASTQKRHTELLWFVWTARKVGLFDKESCWFVWHAVLPHKVEAYRAARYFFLPRWLNDRAWSTCAPCRTGLIKTERDLFCPCFDARRVNWPQLSYWILAPNNKIQLPQIEFCLLYFRNVFSITVPSAGAVCSARKLELTILGCTTVCQT
jgi:hypothetical protein